MIFKFSPYVIYSLYEDLFQYSSTTLDIYVKITISTTYALTDKYMYEQRYNTCEYLYNQITKHI